MTERWDSLPAMLLGLAARWRDRPMLRHWVRDGSGGDWQRMSWAGFAHAVAAAAAGLRARGVMPGDRVRLVDATGTAEAVTARLLAELADLL